MSRKKKKDNTGLLIAGSIGVAGLLWWLSQRKQTVQVPAVENMPSMPQRLSIPREIPVQPTHKKTVTETTPIPLLPEVKKKTPIVVDQTKFPMPVNVGPTLSPTRERRTKVFPQPNINPNTALELLPKSKIDRLRIGLRDEFATRRNPFNLR